MKRILFRSFIVAVMIGGILPMTGLAQGYRSRGYDKINRREDSQRNRIQRGISSGQLTRREAAKLINQQNRIENYEYASRINDGRLDRQERRRINRMLDRSSHNIYRQKHDRQRRYRLRDSLQPLR
jgi:hypothetical protein